MKFLKGQELEDAFNAAVDKNSGRTQNKDATFGETLPILRGLSEMTALLQAAGMDIRLTVFQSAAPMAFNFFTEKELTIPVCGILEIGETQRLLAIATRADKKKCLKIGISYQDIRFIGGKTSPDTSFDVGNDADAWIAMQKQLLEWVAREKLIRDNDVAGGFENTAKSLKPALKGISPA